MRTTYVIAALAHVDCSEYSSIHVNDERDTMAVSVAVRQLIN